MIHATVVCACGQDRALTPPPPPRFQVLNFFLLNINFFYSLSLITCQVENNRNIRTWHLNSYSHLFHSRNVRSCPQAPLDDIKVM